MPRIQVKQFIVSLCVLLCSVGTWVVPVQASEEPLQLTVDYTYEETAIADAKVKIYLVAEKQDEEYVLAQQFETLDVVFESTSTPTSWREAGKTVEQYIADHRSAATDSQRLDDAGQADFVGLVEGVYFVDVQDVPYEDGVLVSAPVLVTLPLFDNDTNEFDYDVTMEPKVALMAKPDEPTSTRPSKPDETEPPESTEPSEPEPTKPSDPDDPDEFLDIFDEDVPLTGTLAWLIAPLAIAGVVFFGYGLFGFGKKKEEQ